MYRARIRRLCQAQMTVRPAGADCSVTEKKSDYVVPSDARHSNHNALAESTLVHWSFFNRASSDKTSPAVLQYYLVTVEKIRSKNSV